MKLSKEDILLDKLCAFANEGKHKRKITTDEMYQWVGTGYHGGGLNMAFGTQTLNELEHGDYTGRELRADVIQLVD